MTSKNIMATLSALVAVAAAAPVLAADVDASAITAVSCVPTHGDAASLFFDKTTGVIDLVVNGKQSSFELKKLSQIGAGEAMLLGYSKELGYIEVAVSSTSASTIQALGYSYYAKCEAK